MAHTEQLRLMGGRYVESTGVDCALSEAKAMSAPEESAYLHEAGNTAA